jgi:hypothetical protein
MGPVAISGPTPGIASANSHQPSQQHSANDNAGGSAPGSAFRCFSIFLDGKVLGSLVICEKDRHVIIAKAFGTERVDRVFNVRLSLINSKCRCIFACR